MGLVWPVAAGSGFLALIVLVTVLGLGSTKRYEQERSRPARDDSADGSPSSLAAVPAPVAVGGSTGRLPDEPAAERQPQRVAGWWLVRVGGSEAAPGPAEGTATYPVTGPITALATARTVAGPFPDRLDAEIAALAGSTGPAQPVVRPEVSVVYGVRRPDGTLAHRPAPADLAWLAELGGLLDRLPGEWETVVSDTDPRTTLVVELAAALAEAGLPIHDCESRTTDSTGAGAADRAILGGGVCLTPHADGALVSWAATDRLALHSQRAALEVAVRETMAAALTDVLVCCGFPVNPQPGSSALLVPVLER